MTTFTKGATDKSVVIRIVDETTGQPRTDVTEASTDLEFFYRRYASAVTTFSPAALASASAAHTDGGIKHLAAGYYRLDLPDAALASGVDSVLVGGTLDAGTVIGTEVQLVDYDPAIGVHLPPVADAIWDEARAGHVTAGTFGEYVIANVTLVEGSDATTTIQALAAAALVDINLDHLVKIAVDTDFATTVHIDSVLAHVCDAGGSASFNRATDSLEAIRDRGDTAWVEPDVPAATLVDENYGGEDSLAYIVDGVGIVGALIRIFLTSDYVAGNRTDQYVLARSSTIDGGKWDRPVALEDGSYSVIFSKPGLASLGRIDFVVS